MKVYLKKECAYAGIFPDGVPVKYASPTMVTLENGDRVEAYLLDVHQCTEAQINSLTDMIAGAFHADPVDVLGDIMTVGMPIRTTQVESSAGIPLRMFH